jgi:hypothetical protein
VKFISKVFLIAVALLSVDGLYALEPCQLHLVKLLRRLPPESVREYRAENQLPVKRLDPNSPALSPLLHPRYRAEMAEHGPVEFSVVGTDGFQKLINETNGKGFWILYSPADPSNRNPVGHTSVSINDTYFTGQYAMESLKGVNARLDNNPYIVAQFIELSNEGTRRLDKFMNDRIWYYRQGHPDYRSNYVVHPFSRDSKVECGENCVNSNLGFMEEKWRKLRPELNQVLDEIGSMKVSEVPNRQVYFSTLSPAYRGTVIVTHKPSDATQWITRGDFNSSHTGKQLLFDGLPQPIENSK